MLDIYNYILIAGAGGTLDINKNGVIKKLLIVIVIPLVSLFLGKGNIHIQLM